MNNEYLEFHVEEEDLSFFIQPVVVSGSGKEGGIFQEASSGKDKIVTSFEKALRPIRFIANSFVSTIQMLADQPDEVTLETSVAFTQGGSIIFLKSNLATTFSVTIKWKKKEVNAISKNPK